MEEMESLNAAVAASVAMYQAAYALGTGPFSPTLQPE
jgi:hypothetical protein